MPVTNLPLDLNPVPFLTLEEFNEIKSRASLVPNSTYKVVGDEITEHKDRFALCFVRLLGSHNFLANARQDIEKLVRHVENAEVKNNELEAQNRALAESNRKLIENLEQIRRDTEAESQTKT